MKRPSLRLLTALSVAASLTLSAGVVCAEGAPQSAKFWWPDELDLAALRQHAPASNPLGADFDYAKAFNTLDLDAVERGYKAGVKAHFLCNPHNPVGTVFTREELAELAEFVGQNGRAS